MATFAGFPDRRGYGKAPTGPCGTAKENAHRSVLRWKTGGFGWIASRKIGPRNRVRVGLERVSLK